MDISNDKESTALDISDLLQIVLSLQAEVGVISDIILDVLKTGNLNVDELARALNSVNEMSMEALEYITGDDDDENGADGDGGGENTSNIH
jgi:hypothetical protein